MADPYLGQISTFGFAFAPRHWAFCNGQIMNVNQNQALFSLLGNNFGGSYPNTFGLPDLRGRTPIHQSQVYPTIGGVGGAESVALSANSMPAHNHTVLASGEVANLPVPNGTFYLAAVPSGKPPAYAPFAPGSAAVMGSQSVSVAGAGGGHNNMQPYLAINFCIALSGTYPSRN